jgi:hypothetical protein
VYWEAHYRPVDPGTVYRLAAGALGVTTRSAQ